MQDKELQAETKADSEQMPIVASPAQMPQNPMLPAVLHLTLTKKWFDMIKSGEKKEEYRQDKMYWKDRFVKKGYWHSQTCKDFDIIRFKNGYAKNAPTMEVECKGICLSDLDKVNPNWFGSFQDYEGCRIFIISLGSIISVSA